VDAIRLIERIIVQHDSAAKRIIADRIKSNSDAIGFGSDSKVPLRSVRLDLNSDSDSDLVVRTSNPSPVH